MSSGLQERSLLNWAKERASGEGLIVVVGPRAWGYGHSSDRDVSYADVIRAGLKWVGKRGKHRNGVRVAESWIRKRLQRLEPTNLPTLREIANEIQTSLVRGEAYQDFLADLEGQMKQGDDAGDDVPSQILQCLQNECNSDVLILTTNHHRRLEDSLGFKPVSIADAGRIENFYNKENLSSIVHLHGFYENAQSFQLGILDYDEYLQKSGVETMLKNLVRTHDVLLLGCDDSAADPNLDLFLSWLRSVGSGDSNCYLRFNVIRGIAEGQQPTELKDFSVSPFDRVSEAMSPATTGETPASAMQSRSEHERTESKYVPGDRRTCFVIRGLNDGDATNIMDRLIRPACLEKGYITIDANDLPAGSHGQLRMYDELDAAAMAIAIIQHSEHGWNANVMIEIGYRMGLGKPILLLFHEPPEAGSLPFDLTNYTWIEVRSNEVDNVVVQKIEKGIESAAKNRSAWESALSLATLKLDYRSHEDHDDRIKCLINDWRLTCQSEG